MAHGVQSTFTISFFIYRHLMDSYIIPRVVLDANRLSLLTTECMRYLISLQSPRSMPYSSLLTLSRPLPSSSLQVTDRSFRYVSPCLWNRLPDSFCQSHPGLSTSHSPHTSDHLFYQVTAFTIRFSIALSA